MKGTGHFSFLREARRSLNRYHLSKFILNLRSEGANGSLTGVNCATKHSDSRTKESFILFMYCLALSTLCVACEFLRMWLAGVQIIDRLWPRSKAAVITYLGNG